MRDASQLALCLSCTAEAAKREANDGMSHTEIEINK